MGLDVSVHKGAKDLESLCEIHGEEGEVRSVSMNGVRVDKKSKKHPDHMFTLGYFRSSYNSSGFNRVARQLTGMDMYVAFSEKVLIDDSGQFGEYMFVPDWEDARKKLKTLRKKLVESERFLVDTVEVQEPKVTSEEEALEYFKKEWKNGQDNEDHSYSSAYGEFSIKKPMEIYGIIKGSSDMFGKVDPCVYVITRMKDVDWYIEAADVMIETCDMAIKDKNHTYFMYWWG